MAHTAELVSTGAELLSGRTLNRHAQTLGQVLGPLGFRLVRDTTVPDDIDLIEEAIAGALRRVELVFVSGGLGPTSDDVTRDGLARLLKRGLAVDPGALARLAERYRQAGREVTEMATRQVLVVEGAEVLPNPVGMAPGQRLDGPNGQTLFVLPGPPREFAAVLDGSVLPWLRVHRPPPTPWREQLFMVGAVPEAEVARRLEEAGLPPHGVTIGYCAAPGRVEVRVNGQDAAGLDACAARVRDLLGGDVYAEARVPLQDCVIGALAHRHLTLATAEGASDGELARSLSAAPDSRGVFCGGLVTGRNRVLTDLCGVASSLIREEGGIGEAAARRLAAALRDRFGADIGLAVTDASQGQAGRPDGQVAIGIDDGSAPVAFTECFTGGGGWRAEWVAQVALNHLRRVLALPPGPGPG